MTNNDVIIIISRRNEISQTDLLQWWHPVTEPGLNSMRTLESQMLAKADYG